MSLTKAIPTNCGVTSDHIGAIHGVCKKKNAFLIVRPSEVETMRLINKGFATKSMDIHDKSSNWGLTSGMVPVDPRFSKKKSGQPITTSTSLEKTHGEAQSIQLELPAALLAELATTHFKVTRAQRCGCGAPADWEHYHHAGEPKFCFQVEPRGRKAYWLFKSAALNNNRKPIPLYVWAYNVSGKWIPVTGDYDMWMVAPHCTMVSDLTINSVSDEHGRSAATTFTTELIGELNAACRRANNPVFNHGAEAQNFSFTQELDRSLAVFCPGSQIPFVVNQDRLPRLAYDMLCHGYLATMNPKWRDGATLGIEDMAYALDDDLAQHLGKEKGGQIARTMRNQGGAAGPGADQLAQVETAAAQAIQRALRKRAGQRSSLTPTKRLEAMRRASIMRALVDVERMTTAQAIQRLNDDVFDGQNRGMALTIYNDFRWQDRADKLKLFRRIADVVGMKEAPANLGDPFPQECFQTVRRRGRNLAEEAHGMAAQQEAGFGRQRFERDSHGHAVPIDESR